MYDIRKYLPSGTFPLGHRDVEAYLNRADVREAIHAVETAKHVYSECADPPYEGKTV